MSEQEFSIVLRIPDDAAGRPQFAAILAAGARPGEYVHLANSARGLGIEFVDVKDVNLTPLILGVWDFCEEVRMTPAVSRTSPRELVERSWRLSAPSPVEDG